MRIRTICSTLILMLALFVGCGGPPQSSPSIVGENMTAAPATATPQPTAPALPTVEPIAIPTAVPTAEPTAAPTEVPTAIPPAVIADTNDTPHLDESAGVQPIDQPIAAAPSQPVRLQIPAIDLDYQPVSVGLDPNNIPIVPKHDVGWYNLSAMPGQGENVVFWGHVLRFKAQPNIPAPFARVKELQPGASIFVTTETGQRAEYKVRTAVQVTPDQVSYILPVGKEQVTLVSCIGDNVIAGGGVTKKYRLITIADRVQ